MNLIKWLVAALMICSQICLAEDSSVFPIRSSSGQEFYVLASDLKDAYQRAFNLGKSTNYAQRSDNEDGTVTLIAPKYRHENVDYSVAMFHENRDDANGICKLYGFSAHQRRERDLTLNIQCAVIDSSGHFSGIRNSHMPDGRESFYDCIASITCIP